MEGGTARGRREEGREEEMEGERKRMGRMAWEGDFFRGHGSEDSEMCLELVFYVGKHHQCSR